HACIFIQYTKENNPNYKKEVRFHRIQLMTGPFINWRFAHGYLYGDACVNRKQLLLSMAVRLSHGFKHDNNDNYFYLNIINGLAIYLFLYVDDMLIDLRKKILLYLSDVILKQVFIRIQHKRTNLNTIGTRQGISYNLL
ncbi:hypothetical protein ACJX0J_028049, partial [Zea mays]